MKHILLTALLLAILQFTGCVGYPLVTQGYGNGMAQRNALMAERDIAIADNEIFGEKMAIITGIQGSPDTDAWHEQRQRLSQTTGDRVFDKDFGRVYDSLVLAVSTLELKVNNMERTSGYIQATGIALSPTESKAIRHDAVRDWCIQKGFDPNIPDKQFSNPQRQIELNMMENSSGPFGQPVKAQKGLTFQLVKMGNDQTKVKLRFSDVYYPAEMEAFYKLIWQAVDKQIFVDKNIEGAVEERK